MIDRFRVRHRNFGSRENRRMSVLIRPPEQPQSPGDFEKDGAQ
jgi:hypothetical protein